MRRRTVGAVALLVQGCSLAPGYHRPGIEAPPAYRSVQGAAAEPAAAARSLGCEDWWRVYQDPVLQQLIRAALDGSYDLKIAATRVLQAQAQLGVTRAGELPSLSLGADATAGRMPQTATLPAYTVRAGEIDASVLWNLDFWGRYRSQTAAARAEWLASGWGQRAVVSSLVAGVATAYFQLRSLDLQLEIATGTLKSRQESLRLTRVLAEHGSASTLDVRQAEQLVYTATATIADLERQRAQQENALSVLIGANPGDIPRGRPLLEQVDLTRVPSDLPSGLLQRRPDIREAEQHLIAANAQIGVARAAFFPSISLTGSGGSQSHALNQLFTQPAELWSAAAALSQPIFQGGALRAGLKLAKAQHEEQLLTYRQTVINAFRQVSDALVALEKGSEQRRQQQLLTDAARDADRLSHVLYEHGGASYLQVLTAETNYFNAQLGLAATQLNERLALVQLYNALGGGWGTEASNAGP